MEQENDEQMTPRIHHKKLFSTLTKYPLPFEGNPSVFARIHFSDANRSIITVHTMFVYSREI